MCWANATAESFSATIRNELIYPTSYQARKHAERDRAAYTELFFNRQRLHSGLGCRTGVPPAARFSECQ